MRVVLTFLLLSMALLSAGPSPAQQPTPPDSAARPAAQPAMQSAAPSSPSATDVIVRTNGDELSARVLRITPQIVRYLPVQTPATTNALSAAPADTLLLPAAEVFMVRYANGTREMLRPISTGEESGPDPQAALVGLSTAQRYERGRQDSRRYYKPMKGVFWGTFAGTLTTFYGGLVVGGATALTTPRRAALNAPVPDLLKDPAYYDGYAHQARSSKLGKAAAGFGVGTGALVVVYTAIIIALINTFN